MYDESESAEHSKEEETTSETALLPKSLFGGHKCKPGDKYTVEVVKVYSDEIEVRHVKGEEKEEETPESPMSTAEAGLESMASATEA